MNDSLLVFAAVAFVTVASPGPTSLLALGNGARWGLRSALPGIAGAALSDLVSIAAVGLGLGAVFADRPWALEVLRWLGVACLAWIGLQLIRSPAPSPPGDAPQASAPASRPARVLLRSFGVAVSNPKGCLFFLALLPAFVEPRAPALPQYLGLAVTFAAIDAAVLLAYAGAGALGAARIGQGRRKPLHLDRLSGSALLGMAIALALWRSTTH